LFILGGVLLGLSHIVGGLAPIVLGHGRTDLNQAALGAAILLPCLYMFWQFHTG
jgi:hypothetical protein